jgi:hypothetical protein
MVEIMKRYKRALVRVGIGGGALLLLVAACGFVLLRYAHSGLDRRIAAIRAAGDPVFLRDLARPAIAPEQNAATFLSQAQQEVSSINRKLSAVYDSPTYQKCKLTEGECKAIRAALAAHLQVIPLLEQAAACQDFNDQRYYIADPQALIPSLLPDQQSFRITANVLRAHASVLATEGDARGAIHSCVLLFRLTRLYEREPPLLVNYLMTTACRGVAVRAANAALRSGPVPGTARDELERELAIDDGLKAYQQTLRTERAAVIQNFDAWARTWSPFLRVDQCALLDLLAEQLALSNQPYAAALSSYQPGKPGVFAALRPMTGLMLPSLHKTREAMDRVRAQMRCLRVLNALQRRKPSTPDSPNLTDLGLPSESVTDPYDGNPLHLKKLPNGWLIYAVGENLADDGGDLDRRKDIGLGPLTR